MFPQRLMKLSSLFFLGLLFIALQVSANPLDRRTLPDVPESDQKRDTSSVPTPITAGRLSKRVSPLAALWSSIPKSDLVKIDAVDSKTLRTDTALKYGTVEYYGCTVVLIVNGKGVTIGHFAEVTRSGGVQCIAMDKYDLVKTKIVDRLRENELLYDWDATTNVFILHTSTAKFRIPGSTKLTSGFEMISNLFTQEFDVPAANIHEFQYSSSQPPVEGYVGQARGKAVIEWIPLANGEADQRVWYSSDEVRWAQVYNRDGAPITVACAIFSPDGHCSTPPSPAQSQNPAPTTPAAPSPTTTTAPTSTYAKGKCRIHLTEALGFDFSDQPVYVDTKLYDANNRWIGYKTVGVDWGKPVDTYSELPIIMRTTPTILDKPTSRRVRDLSGLDSSASKLDKRLVGPPPAYRPQLLGSYIQFEYGNQHWSTSSPQCTVGGWDNHDAGEDFGTLIPGKHLSIRKMDCTFDC